VEAHPWIKRFAATPGFLGPVFRRSAAPSPEEGVVENIEELITSALPLSKKRKADNDSDSVISSASKRVKESGDIVETNGEAESKPLSTTSENSCKAKALPSALLGQFSLFFKTDFRDHLCRCSDCFPALSKHPQLLEEEDNYEPPLSEDGEDAGGSTIGSGSIYERGESALKNVDRVRAIEGVMAYNHLKEKLRPLFEEFAGSGKALGAEDIKAYFAKLRGDDQAIKEAGDGAKTVDNRREQSGY
jgi:E3 ubiquitin-protein ligase UBR7